MYRTLLPAVAATLVLVACDQATPPTEIPAGPGAQRSGPSFAAITEHERSRGPLVVFIFDECTGDDLELTGETIFQSNVTQLPSGELRIEGLSIDQVSGTGPSTGLSYRGHGVTHFTFNTRGGLPYVQVGVGNLRIDAPGPHNLLLVRFRFHLTVNANGEVTVSRELGSVECH